MTTAAVRLCLIPWPHEKGFRVRDRVSIAILTRWRIVLPSISKFSDRQKWLNALCKTWFHVTAQQTGLWVSLQPEHGYWIRTGRRLRQFLWLARILSSDCHPDFARLALAALPESVP